MLRRSFLGVLSAAPVLAVSARSFAQLRSPASDVPAWMTIRNLTSVNLEICWIDFSGGYVSYGVIPPGGSQEQSTYAGHVWALRNAATRVDFGNAVARAGRQLVEVTPGGVMIR
jgi:hypothetical protein